MPIIVMSLVIQNTKENLVRSFFESVPLTSQRLIACHYYLNVCYFCILITIFPSRMCLLIQFISINIYELGFLCLKCCDILKDINVVLF